MKRVTFIFRFCGYYRFSPGFSFRAIYKAGPVPGPSHLGIENESRQAAQF
jgi:hypothetical protein